MQIIINNPGWILLLFLFLALFLLILLASMVFFKPIFRKVISKITDNIVTRLLSDKYSQNLMEMWPSLKRYSVLNLFEMVFVLKTGRLLHDP